MSARLGIAAALVACALVGRPARALDVQVLRDGVRLDLATGRPLDGALEDAAPVPASFVLRAARDEVVALQLVLRSAAATASVAVRVEAPASVIGSTFVEHAVELERRRYPEVLVPADRVDVPAAPAIAVVWVDLWVRPEASPGRATVALRVGDAPPIPIALDVLPLTVGGGPAFSVRTSSASLAVAALLHAHGVDLEVAPVDEASRAIVSGAAFSEASGYRGPRAGVGAPRARVPAPLDAEAAWLAAITAFAPPPGPTTWIVSLPPVTSADDLARAVAWGERLSALDEARRRALVVSVDGVFGRGFAGLDDADVARRLAPVVDEWRVIGSVGGSPWNVLEARREDDHRERVVVSSGPGAGLPATPPLGVDAPLAGARAWAWVVHEYALDGAELSAQVGCVEGAGCAPEVLDRALWWAAADGPVPRASLRLKALRRGIQDAALLAQLAAHDADTARALGDIMVPSAMGDEQRDQPVASWPLSPSEYDHARDQILDRLLGAHPSEGLGAVRPEIPSDPVRRWGGWPVVVLGALVLVVLIVRGAASASRT